MRARRVLVAENRLQGLYNVVSLPPHVEVLARFGRLSKIGICSEFTKPVRDRLLELPHVEVLAGFGRIIVFRILALFDNPITHRWVRREQCKAG